VARETETLWGQYNKIKRQYPDVILLFRLGDFYEMFGQDAETAARELELTLTGRDVAKSGERVPMCGVPHHAAERYIARLIAKGYRVAVCDQLEDPRFAKNIIKRGVTRVVTPGTVLEDSMLEAKRSNYLVAVVPGEGEEPTAFGLAVCDVSTGEFLVTEIAGSGALARTAEELARLAPAELLLSEAGAGRWGPALTQGQPIPVTPLKTENFPRHSPRDLLLRHFGVQSLRGYGCEDLPLAVAAAAEVLRYLTLSQLAALEHIRSLATYSTSDFMGLDGTARRNLELTSSMGEGGRSRSLLSVIDATCTPMGGRLLRKWVEQPLLDVDRINRRLDAVEELAGAALLRGEVREPLGRVADLERLISRCATATANGRDLVSLKNSLSQMGPLREALLPAGAPLLVELRDRLDGLDDLVACIAAAIVDEPPPALKEGGLIRPGYSEPLDTLRTTSSDGKEWIANLEATERERTGIKSLKVGYNSVFGYYIEVTKPNLPYIPSDYHRKQTTANGERYITPDLKEREAMILGAEERIIDLEFRLFSELREAIGKEATRVLTVAAALAELDVLAAFAETAVRGGYSRPTVEDSAVIEIRGGRHPVVEKLGVEAFIPNDCRLDETENRMLIITGPNMAGKCVSGDTLIYTKHGLRPIEALRPPEACLGQFAPISDEVQGLTGRRRATHFYTGGRQSTRKVTSRLGFEIEGTPEHQVWVRRPDGTEGWSHLADLAVGDVVALERQINLWGDETRIERPDKCSTMGAISHQLPETLDEDLAYLIGLLVGDGTLTYRNSFLLSTADEFIAAEFQRIVERHFACHVGCKSNGKDLFVTRLQVRQLLFILGLDYCRAHEKHVPHAVLRAPRHIVIAFLQGLFDTDGYAAKKYGNVQLSTASRRLAREVQLLLLNLGIVASLHTKKTTHRPAHQVSIYGADAITFHREVGFRLPRKQARAALASSVRMPNVGGIPYLNDSLKQVQARIVATSGKPQALKRNKSVNSIFYTYLPTGRNVSHDKLHELITYCHQNSVDCVELEALHSTHYFYDRVAAIEEGEAEVFDLSVEEEHAYVAGGFVSHNSTYLRQVALIVLLAQCGSMVPADAARIGIVDRIFTRVGAHDDLASGQSTFMVEMNETASILNNASDRSLIILDEIGRGTSTYDGLSIAWAVCEYLQRLGAKTLFATHYHHLNDLAERLPGIKNYRAAVKEDGHDIIWLRKIVPGGTDRSYGIQVARLAGLPDEVIRRAREVLKELEDGGSAGLPPVDARVQTTTTTLQLALFEAEEHPVVTELRKLDVSSMTPIEALTRLDQLQRRANA